MPVATRFPSPAADVGVKSTVGPRIRAETEQMGVAESTDAETRLPGLRYWLCCMYLGAYVCVCVCARTRTHVEVDGDAHMYVPSWVHIHTRMSTHTHVYVIRAEMDLSVEQIRDPSPREKTSLPPSQTLSPKSQWWVRRFRVPSSILSKSCLSPWTQGSGGDSLPAAALHQVQVHMACSTPGGWTTGHKPLGHTSGPQNTRPDGQRHAGPQQGGRAAPYLLTTAKASRIGLEL